MGQLASDVGALSAPVRIIGTERSWQWLRAGWADMKKAPLISLLCGAIPVALGYILLFGLDRAGVGYLIVPLSAGFFLIGPLIAVGFYEISRTLAAGETPSLFGVLGAWRRNFSQLALLGLILALFMLAWLLTAAILFALFMGGEAISMERDVIRQVIATDASIPFVLFGTFVGGVLAAIAFTFTAISFPMLLDRKDGVLTALCTSCTAVTRNWRVMLGWAAMIVLFAGAGLFTYFIGLVVAMPLIGHASWHAYRDLVAAGS